MPIQTGNNCGFHVSNTHRGTNRITENQKEGWLLECLLLLFCLRIHTFISPCFALVFIRVNVGLGGQG